MKTKFAETQADFFRIVRIRTEVFVIEQQVDLHIEQDQDDETALHWLVENEAGERLDFGKKEISSVHLTADLDAEMDEDIPPDEE